jgi:hypothetical protein
MANSVKSFSYLSEKQDIIKKAEMLAERNHETFSEFVVDALEHHIKRYMEIKKAEASRIPILSRPPAIESSDDNPQKTILSFLDIDPNILNALDVRGLEKFRLKCVDLSIHSKKLKHSKLYPKR